MTVDRPKVIRLFLALILLSWFVGCASLPVSLDETPVVYAAHFSPKALTPELIEEMESVVNALDQPQQPWFIFVRYHRRDRCRAEIYFPPNNVDDDLRRGKVALSGAFGFRDQRRLSEQMEVPWPVVAEYIQVNEPGAGWPEAPSQAALPFFPQEEFSDDEVVQMIAVARQFVRDKQAEDGGILVLDDDIDDMPFKSIEQWGGRIRVYFGWQVTGRNGRGISVAIERQGEGFIATDCGGWWS